MSEFKQTAPRHPTVRPTAGKSDTDGTRRRAKQTAQDNRLI
jgi:hypothetical protein